MVTTCYNYQSKFSIIISSLYLPLLTSHEYPIPLVLGDIYHQYPIYIPLISWFHYIYISYIPIDFYKYIGIYIYIPLTSHRYPTQDRLLEIIHSGALSGCEWLRCHVMDAEGRLSVRALRPGSVRIREGWRSGSYGYGSIPISTIFRVMNIHLPAILGFTKGTRVLTHPHILWF